MPLKLPKPDPNRIAEKVVGDFIEDPLATVINAENYVYALIELLPVMPWEFPIPMPRGLYRRLMLKELMQQHRKR